MFRALVNDALYAASAHPLGIVRGQGRMWVLMPNISEAQRAFGVLVMLDGRLSGSFAVEGAFQEASQYSRNRWSPAATADTDLTEPAASPPAEARPELERFTAAPLPALGISADNTITPATIDAQSVAPLPAPMVAPLPVPSMSEAAIPNACRTRPPAALANASPIRPLAEHLSTPQPQRLPGSAPPGPRARPLASRIAPPTLAERLAHSPPLEDNRVGKKVRMEPTDGADASEAQTSSPKKRKAQASEIMAQAEAESDPSLLAWLPTLEVVAELDEEGASFGWGDDEDDDMDIGPVAGPSNFR
ncbi:hypothetical protein FB451DRAFT_1398663 [Mycena latifolia]|nr:hypothetical protein FB451DRAFT_1398663 [Mycena latifolia]